MSGTGAGHPGLGVAPGRLRGAGGAHEGAVAYSQGLVRSCSPTSRAVPARREPAAGTWGARTTPTLAEVLMLQSVTGPHIRGEGLDGDAALARPERRTPARPMWA